MTGAAHSDSPGRARIVFASDTSGHSMGYHVVARAFRDAGFEVVLTGRLMPDAVATVAVQENADLVAYRMMDRDPLEVVRALLAALEREGLSDRPVLVGGIIGKAAAAAIREAGVAGVFGPGSKLTEIVACAQEALAQHRQWATSGAGLAADGGDIPGDRRPTGDPTSR